MAFSRASYILLFSFVIAGVAERPAKNFEQQEVPQDTERKLTFSPGHIGLDANWATGLITFVYPDGQARKLGVKDGWSFVQIDGQPYSEALLDAKIAGGSSYVVTFFVRIQARRASYANSFDVREKWEYDQKQRWVNVNMSGMKVMGDIESLRGLKRETSKLYAEIMSSGNAEQDVIGSWRFNNRSRTAAFNIRKEGATLVLSQNLEGESLAAPLRASGEWWQGESDVSVIGGGSNDVIRIRRRGDTLLCNTKGPGDSQWRGTIVAFKEGDDSAPCHNIVGSDSKVNFTSTNLCHLRDSSGFLHIRLPEGEHLIDKAFVLKKYGTVLLQGAGDKAGTVLKCSRKHPAFKFNDGAELLLEDLVVDSCGAFNNESGAILIHNKDKASLRLRDVLIRRSVGHGVRMTRSSNSKVVLEHGSTISDSGSIGLSVRAGKDNIVSLSRSMITRSRVDGFLVMGGMRSMFFMENSTISSGTNGFHLSAGTDHTVSLAFSTINDSKTGVNILVGKNCTIRIMHSTINNAERGLSAMKGKRHTISLVDSTINSSRKDGLRLVAGQNMTVIVGYSTITGSGGTGINMRNGRTNTLSVGYSTISDIGKYGIKILEGKDSHVFLGYSTISNSGHHGLCGIFRDINEHDTWHLNTGLPRSTINMLHSTISSSGQDGIYSVLNNYIFNFLYSTISGSGENGIYAARAAEVSFHLGYSKISDSGENGFWSSEAKEIDFSLWHSRVTASRRNGIYETSGANHSYSLGFSTIGDSGNDCFFAEGSSFTESCTFDRCGGMAFGTTGDHDDNLLIRNTNIQNSQLGLKLRGKRTNVSMENLTFWNITSAAVSTLKGVLYTKNVSVYASGVAFYLGDVSWEGSSTTAIGNENGIECSRKTRGMLATSFVYLNGIHDTDDCDGLALDAPLPTKVHVVKLELLVCLALLAAITLTVALPIIQDPPREFRDCTWLLLGLSVVATAMWLAEVTVVLCTAHHLFQRIEHDETKYGADTRAWAMRFILILVMGIFATVVAVIAAFLGRKKFTFLRATAQLALDSEERRKCQQDLAQQRSDYSNKLKESHEAMVKHVSSAACCQSPDEGQHYLKAAQDHFAQMKTLARDNGKELDSKLHHDVQDMYRADTMRWQTLIDVESISQQGRYQGEHMIPFSKITAGDLALINAEELNEEVTNRLLLAASWGRSMFQKALEQVAIRLNEAGHVNDLIHELSGQFPSVAEQLKTITPEVRNLKGHRYKLLRDVKATMCGQHCNVQMGPNKTHASASRKAAMLHDEHVKNPPKDASEWEMPAARYLLDLLRATIVFADPVALAAYFYLLATEFTVVSTKNKYQEPLEKVGSPSILVNVEIDTNLGKLTGEVQLYLDKFLDLKFLAHTNYEVDRVRDLDELLSPFEH